MSWHLHIHCLLTISLALAAAAEFGLEQRNAGHGSRVAGLASFEGGQSR